MEQSTIAIIIIVATLVLYATERLPITVTTLLAMLAMIFSGILTTTAALSGFSSVAMIMATALVFMGEILGATGFSEKIGDLLHHFTALPKKPFILVLCIFCAIASIFVNVLVIVPIMMTILDGVSQNTNGRISRRETYMPATIGGLIGGGLSIIGASSTITAVNMYIEHMGGNVSVGFFEPAMLCAPALIGVLLFYATIGTRLQEKWFDFEETPIAESTIASVKDSTPAEEKEDKRRLIFSSAIFGICILLWIFSDINMAVIALLGVCAMIVTRCGDEEKAYSSMNWAALIVLGASTGFASGVQASGAGTVLAELFVKLAGPLGNSPYAMCAVILVLTGILTSVMSNTAAVVCVMPIAMALADGFGTAPIAYAMAVSVGSSLSFMTPIAATVMTMILKLGYRFKDYFRVGGLIWVFCVVITIVAMKFIYFM